MTRGATRVDFEWQYLLGLTLYAAHCVHGKCWRKGGGEERYTELSDMAWGPGLSMNWQ